MTSHPARGPQDILVTPSVAVFLSAGCRKEPQNSRELIQTHWGCMMSCMDAGQLEQIVSVPSSMDVQYSGVAGKARGHRHVYFLPGALVYNPFAHPTLMMSPFSCCA